MVMEMAHPGVVDGVEDDVDFLLLGCFKLVVLDHCHWTLNYARIEENIY